MYYLVSHPSPEIINKFMLNRAEHDIFLAHTCYNAKISTFISRKNGILGLSRITSYLVLKNAEFLDIFIYLTKIKNLTVTIFFYPP